MKPSKIKQFEKLDLDITLIGNQVYLKNEKLTPELLDFICASEGISITQQDAKIFFQAICKNMIYKDIPRYTKKLNHPIFGAPKKILQPKFKETKELNPIELLEEFPFADEISKSRALALMITPFIYIGHNAILPVGIYLGNRERIGKDYLASLTRQLANNDSGEFPPLKNEEETRKILQSITINQEEFAHFANNTGHMASSALEQAITARVLKGRILGSNEISTMPFNVIVTLSGNTGWTLTSDMFYRSLIVALHLDDDSIIQRKFEKSPVTLIQQNRAAYWKGIKKMYRIWVEKGKPNGSINHATFPEWARIIGGILEANGYINPLTPSQAGTLYTLADRDAEEWKKLLPLIYDLKIPVTGKEIQELAENCELFEFFDFKKHGMKVAFGKLIKKFTNRWFGKYRLIASSTILRGANSNKQHYLVEVKGDLNE